MGKNPASLCVSIPLLREELACDAGVAPVMIGDQCGNFPYKVIRYWKHLIHRYKLSSVFCVFCKNKALVRYEDTCLFHQEQTRRGRIWKTNWDLFWQREPPHKTLNEFKVPSLSFRLLFIRVVTASGSGGIACHWANLLQI